MVSEASGHSMHRLRWAKVSRGLRSSAALPTKHPPAPSGGGETLEISVLVLCGSSTVLRTPFESSLTLSPRNRCIECPDTRNRCIEPAKSIGNGFSMKNYAGAVLRKSFQLELVAEIGPL